jgi:hypothetical protein
MRFHGRALAVWICGSALMSVLSACGGGDTRNPVGNAGGAGGGGGGGGTGTPDFPCASKAEAVRGAPLDQTLCPTYATVEAFEKVVIRGTTAPGCGASTCHLVRTSGSKIGIPWNEPSIQKMDAFVELAGVKNRGRTEFSYCPNDAYIDLVDPQLSYILAKSRTKEPDIACPSDGKVEPESLQMPSSSRDKFDDVKLKCLEAYVIAVSEGCR